MSSSMRVLCASVVLFTAIAAPLAAGEGERESPPERRTVKELETIAKQAGERSPIRPVLPQRTLATTLTWAPLGPASIEYDYWSTGPASGRVSAVVVDPRDGDVAYIAAAQGGVWKTSNGGLSWTSLTDGLSSLASGALALHPADPDIIYYGTGEQHYSGDSFYGDGLFASTDAGVNWSQLALRAQVGSYIARVAFHPVRPETVFVASDRGFVRSVDGGGSWSVTLATGWCNDVVLDPADPDRVYAAMYGAGVYRSTDAGATWTLLAGGLPLVGFERINLAISPSNPQVLYAGFINPSGGLFGLYRTANGGDNWTALPATPNYPGTQGWYDHCLLVDPVDEDVLYAGGVYPYGPGYHGVVKTIDGGASWTDITFGIDGFAVHPDQHALAWGPDGRLWLANDGGVWRTSDGGSTWTNCNNGLDITQFYAVDVHPTNGQRILGGTQDNGTVVYAGAPVWPQVIAGDGGYCLFLWNDPMLYFTTYVQLDPVYEWHETFGFQAEITGPWGPQNDRASFALGPLVQDFNQSNTLLAGTYRVWRTNNLGASWDSLSGDLTGSSVLRGLAVANGASNTIWAGSFDGQLFLTTNGVIWNKRDAPLPRKAINDIWVDPGDALTAYISSDTTSGGRAWLTNDGGQNWTNVSGNLPANLRGMCLAVDWSASPAILYLGTDYGVYRSSDGGVNWEKEDAGLPSVAIFDLEFSPAGELIAGTHGRGMWRGTRSPVAVEPGVPAGTGLALTAANPARLPSTIDYRLPRAGEVSLEVCDVLGRRVRTLERGVRAAGAHRAAWDGCDDGGTRVSGGVYFYRLRLDGMERRMKLALLR